MKISFGAVAAFVLAGAFLQSFGGSVLRKSATLMTQYPFIGSESAVLLA